MQTWLKLKVIFQKLLMISLGLLLFYGCDDDELDAAFVMNYPNLEFEIPAGLNTVESHFFVIRNIPTNRESFFGNFSPEDISAIIPASARLVSLDGGNVDYDFALEISVRLCTTEDGTEDCRFNEIFYRDPVPENVGSEVGMIPNEQNVADFLTQDQFTVAVVLRRLVRPPVTFVRTRLEMRFEAKR